MGALSQPKGRMTQDLLVMQSVVGPIGMPAKAFWSLTLYDTKNGFFIPNLQKKYSVGENAGFKLNEEGGLEVHIAAKKPAGVPDENWLPINPADQGIDVILRSYVPNLENVRFWKVPKAALVKRDQKTEIKIMQTPN